MKKFYLLIAVIALIISTSAAQSEFSNGGWTSHTSLSSARWATAPVFSKACISSADTGFIYLISGYNGVFANTSLNSRLNLSTNTWSAKAPIPSARGQIIPVLINNRIFVMGGYSSSFSPVVTTSIYDIAADTWSTGANMPQKTGDYALGTYNDSLIYIIGGYNGSGDINTVQIYNIHRDTWTIGTAKPGTATAGGRMGISDNKIVYVGGYSQAQAQELDNAYIGVIDPADYTSIIWNTLPALPTGTSGRLAGGVSFQDDGRIYFAGGDPTGSGTSVLNKVSAFNTLTNNWEPGPEMLHGVSNITGLSGIVENGILYLVTMGGYDGTNVVTNNEWLELGPIDPMPFAQRDTTLCAGESITLQAYHAESYAWSFSSALSDTSISNPTASPVGTTTFTVTMEKGYGCPVTDHVIVTVNELPIPSAGTDINICAGEQTALSATGGDTYSWLPSTGLDNTSISNPNADPIQTTTYTVTVTNSATGCSDADEVIVTVNEIPDASISVTDIKCNGGSDGSATVTVEGLSSYLFEWSSGDITVTSDNLTAGTYFVSVTDELTSCKTIKEFTLNEPSELTVDVQNGITTGCNGTLNAVVAGGVADYFYLWNDQDAQTTASANGLCPGEYQVTVTDANNCTASDEAVLNLETGSRPPDREMSFSVYPNPCVDKIEIKAEFEGPCTIIMVNMLGERMLSWVSEESGHFSCSTDVSSLQSGVYFIQVLRENQVVEVRKVVKK